MLPLQRGHLTCIVFVKYRSLKVLYILIRLNLIIIDTSITQLASIQQASQSRPLLRALALRSATDQLSLAGLAYISSQDWIYIASEIPQRISRNLSSQSISILHPFTSLFISQSEVTTELVYSRIFRSLASLADFFTILNYILYLSLPLCSKHR